MTVQRFLAGMAIAGVAGTSGAFAEGGIPVVDTTNLAQTTITAQQALETVRQLQQQYETQLRELNEAVRQVQAMTGERGLGGLVNSGIDHELRRYLPDTWLDTLEIMDRADIPASASDVQRIFEELSETYEVATPDEYAPQRPDLPTAQAHHRTTRTGYATLATSEAAFDQTTRRVATYETFLDELDRTEDVKASIDLAGRIAAENGIAANELLRLQAINLQLAGTLTTQNQVDSSADVRMNNYEPIVNGQIPVN